MKTIYSIFILCVVMLSSPALAAVDNIYIAQSAAGSANGNDCANAYAYTFFNTEGNWDTDVAEDEKIGPGDTVHLCGNITEALTIQGSGSAGNVITILFETGASMTKATGWTTGAISLVTKHYITIDGGSNGYISSTDNGTNLMYQQASTGVYGRNSNYLTVKNLTIGPLYVRPAGQDTYSDANGVTNIAENAVFTNFTVDNCIIHDATRGIYADYNVGSDYYTFTDNEIYNINFGIAGGGRSSSSTLDHVVISGNNIHDWWNWDTTDGSDVGFHHNGVFFWNDNGTAIYNVSIYNNTFGPNYSKAVGGYNASTSGIYLNDYIVGPVLIYNNLFKVTSGEDVGTSNGFITIGMRTSGTIKVLNNTFIGGSTAYQMGYYAGTTTLTVQNNIFSGNVDAYYWSTTTGTLVMTADHNIGYNLGTDPFANGSLAAWQALGRDTDLITSNPSLDASYKPDSASDPGVGYGVNLTSLGITSLNSDKASVARSASGAWDIGAYEYGTTPPSATGCTMNGTTFR